MSKYGTIDFNGKTLELTQQAFCDNKGDGVAYFAHAVDPDGHEYLVTWETTAAWDAAQAAAKADPANYDGSCDDESQACDWTDYSVRAL